MSCSTPTTWTGSAAIQVLERMLAMLLRLKDLRQGTIVG